MHAGPLYSLVENVLAEDIAKDRLGPGDQLPTEDSLIVRFGVSRITVRRAIQNLAGRGLVEVHRGRGTFVAQPRITQELTELSGFVEDMEAVGRRASARVISTGIVAADEIVAERLTLVKGTLVMKIQRVRLADQVAMSFDETYLPLEIGKKVIKNNLEVEPIFSLLEKKYKVPLIEAEYRLESVAATPEVSAALHIETGKPVFLIERTSFTNGGKPIDYEKLHYRGDLIRFVTRLQRNQPR
jgi:GntR family transcriptional regulator